MGAKEELIGIFAAIDSPMEMERLFKELFTRSEIENLVLRWQLLKELHAGKSQRRIAADHSMSLCKITRGAKILKNRDALVRKLLKEN